MCTPKALARQLGVTPVIWKRHLVIVERFDWDSVTQALEGKIVEVQTASRSWDDFTARFSRLAAWEFEDYVDDE